MANEVEAAEESNEQNFGSYLRRERELRQIDIAYISDYTRLGQDRISDLENGDWESFGAPVYLRGAVANYARALGLDIDDTVVRLESEVKHRFEDASKTVADKNNPLFRDTDSKNKGSTKSAWILLVTILIVAAMLWFAFEKERIKIGESLRIGNDSQQVQDMSATVDLMGHQPQIHPATTTTANIAVIATTSTTAETTIDQLKPSQPTRKRRMVIVGIEESWIEYSRDGEPTRSIVLSADKRLVLSAERSIYLRTGNAGGIKISLDGRKLDQLGKPGSVREKTYTF